MDWLGRLVSYSVDSSLILSGWHSGRVWRLGLPLSILVLVLDGPIVLLVWPLT
jgi:di/tricarboxylate transporter